MYIYCKAGEVLTNPRRKARIVALQALYEADSSRHRPKEVITRLLEEKPLPEELATFALSLVDGVVQNRKRIDEIIKQFAPAFPIDQIAVIDRNLLRLAIFEVLFDNKVPVKAAINEAVELAKTFGSSSSPKFVNGVLGAVVAHYLSQESRNLGNTHDDIPAGEA
jgi:N utilization substance protein B